MTAAATVGAWALAGDDDTVEFSFAPISTKGQGVAHSDADGDGKAGLGPRPRDFTITAAVQQIGDSGAVISPFLLYPGATAELALTVSNSSNQPVDVQRLTVTADAAAVDCPAEHLSVGEFVGSLVVPRNGSATTTVPIGLSPGAPDACKDVGFPLTITGEGTKVSNP